MKNGNINDIRTPRVGAKIGERVMKGREPVALVKQGGRKDTLSLEEFAIALYGPGTQCVVIPGKEATSF